MPPIYDSTPDSTYQKHCMCILARLGYRIKIVVIVSIELRKFVFDARVRHRVNWLDRHGVISVGQRVKEVILRRVYSRSQSITVVARNCLSDVGGEQTTRVWR
jgi:hypothetical protein